MTSHIRISIHCTTKTNSKEKEIKGEESQGKGKGKRMVDRRGLGERLRVGYR